MSGLTLLFNGMLTKENYILEKRLSYPIRHIDASVSLVSFYSAYLTPNVTKQNNILHYDDDKQIEIEIGQYKNIEELAKHIQSKEPFNSTNIQIKANTIKNRVEVISDFKLRFNQPNSIGKVLGFEEDIEAKTKSIGKTVPKILPFNTINVHCDLADGMIFKYDDHKHSTSNIISTFNISNIQLGRLISFEPKHLLYFPLNQRIERIRVWFTDENNNPIDFDGANVTVVLNIQL